jgi:hypothetical protein
MNMPPCGRVQRVPSGIVRGQRLQHDVATRAVGFAQHRGHAIAAAARPRL